MQDQGGKAGRRGPDTGAVLTDEDARSRVQINRIPTRGSRGREPSLRDGLKRQAEEAVGHVVQLHEGSLCDRSFEQADGGLGGPEADAVEGLFGEDVSTWLVGKMSGGAVVCLYESFPAALVSVRRSL